MKEGRSPSTTLLGCSLHAWNWGTIVSSIRSTFRLTDRLDFRVMRLPQRASLGLMRRHAPSFSCGGTLTSQAPAKRVSVLVAMSPTFKHVHADHIKSGFTPKALSLYEHPQIQLVQLVGEKKSRLFWLHLNQLKFKSCRRCAWS